jgi:hypothetical protein
VQVTWDNRNYDLQAGFFNSGEEILGDEEIIYEGLLSDVVSQSTIDAQTVDFKIQGFESLFDITDVPFTDISDGDLISEIIYDCLNQSAITDLITVSALNITPNEDVEIDFVEDLENKTVKEALNEMLLISNSVLYVRDRVVYVRSRAPTIDLIYSFYGQASIQGVENILNITKYREGLNRTYNYLTWQDTNLRSRDLTSVQTYGVLKKEIGTRVIDPLETTKIQTLLDSLKAEFAYPKLEFDLETPLGYETMDLFLLDKVKVDYPTPFEAVDDNPLPRYGQNFYGEARYPAAVFSITISDSFRFKILNKKINTSKQTITLGLRRI